MNEVVIRILDNTNNAICCRLLKQWLNRTIINTKILNKSFDVIYSFIDDSKTLDEVRSLLKEVSDIERILGRINNNKVSPKEINGLRFSLEQIPKIKTIFFFELISKTNIFFFKSLVFIRSDM